MIGLIAASTGPPPLTTLGYTRGVDFGWEKGAAVCAIRLAARSFDMTGSYSMALQGFVGALVVGAMFLIPLRRGAERVLP